ncbi:Mu-like prophage major head subunit gpT family protein [Methylobacterium aquaticum]|jgi:phage major head subunit gpT-like protein|uniref:Mu-like prophage major head subunit gpT n=1 Tax=Methylobacterium aquaticum TaxID=270351 RepID=A0A0J6V106_9HYPH|nr:Mu-like prophage major head subunit gpT family protein [Methylobacterium aquaticum]KMO32486.1 Mu-like prophage major head subunit gpT [Methylobacterium aquaticum]
MLVNSANLRTLYTSFSTAFQGGFTGVSPLYTRVAQTVPSSTRSNEYGWLGQLPRIREWIGDRVVQNLATQGYTIRNRSFESTIAVLRDDIDDDNLGIYAPLFQEFGRASATFPDELVWALLLAGFSTNCFDGQFFFDTDHPVLDAAGNTVSFANTDGGNGTAWFLMDTTRAIKPIIYQSRRPFELTRMDAPTDEAVFNRREYRYGTDGRCNVGFGFPQLAWGSRQTLDAAHYEAARVGLSTMKGDYGRPLGINGNLLVVPPQLEGAARKLVVNDFDAMGATNTWKGSAEVLVVPWLA